MKNILLQKGKIPPQAVDLEEAVLGAMLIDKNGLEDALELLQKEVFYNPSHQMIFGAIKNVYKNSDAVDILTISEELKQSGKLDKVGGDFYLIGLTRKIASSAHIEVHSRILLQKFIQRELINKSTELIEKCYDQEAVVFELLEEAYDDLNNISEISIKPQDVPIGDVIKEVLQKGQDIYEGKIKPGIETPIRKLTKRSGGWRDSELIIIAARPGMGKTAFALKCGYGSAKNGIPTAFFSLEMNKQKLVSRILSMEYKLDNDKFNTTGLTIEDLKKIDGLLNKIPLHIDDTPGLSIQTLALKAKRLVNKFGVKLIIVDYLQLMTANAGNREQEISKISRGLKKISMQLSIPIIALSQLSRGVETRGGSKRPFLSDLRESGAIEQDADMVMFIWRPEYYGMTEWDDYNQEPTYNEAEYILAKNRNGGLVRNRMRFQGNYTLFSDLDELTEDEFEEKYLEKKEVDDDPF